MSLYREPRGRRWLVPGILIVVALLAGLGIGLAIGGSEEPDIAQAVEQLHEDLQPALSSLELVEIEYGQGMGSGDAAAETEDEAAQSHLDSATAAFEAVRPDLELISARETEIAAEALTELERSVAERRPPAEVERLVARARAALLVASGMEPPGAEAR